MSTIPPVPQASTPAPEVPVTPPVDPATVLVEWGLPHNNFHNVRVLCDRAGLSLEDKDTICACIYQESQFYNLYPNGKPVIHENLVNGKLASTDWGIVQINDYWHIKRYPDFPSSQYVLDHPQEAVEFMIHCFQNGQLKQWVSYSSGAYKQWLLPNSPMWLLR